MYLLFTITSFTTHSVTIITILLVCHTLTINIFSLHFNNLINILIYYLIYSIQYIILYNMILIYFILLNILNIIFTSLSLHLIFYI